jgi:hypothetical protein
LIDPPFVEDIELEAILLDECNVTRGTADDLEPGKASSDIQVEYTFDSGTVFFLVSTHTTLSNKKDQKLAEVEASFAVLYSCPTDMRTPSEMDIHTYTNGRLMLHVHPFVREFLATVTNRMGLPTFYLPMFRTYGTLIEPRPLDTSAEAEPPT